MSRGVLCDISCKMPRKKVCMLLIFLGSVQQSDSDVPIHKLTQATVVCGLYQYTSDDGHCCNKCPPGNEVIYQCQHLTPESTVCRPCDANTYMSVYSVPGVKCHPHTPCTDRQRETQPGTPTNDNVCECLDEYVTTYGGQCGTREGDETDDPEITTGMDVGPRFYTTNVMQNTNETVRRSVKPGPTIVTCVIVIVFLLGSLICTVLIVCKIKKDSCQRICKCPPKPNEFKQDPKCDSKTTPEIVPLIVTEKLDENDDNEHQQSGSRKPDKDDDTVTISEHGLETDARGSGMELDPQDEHEKDQQSGYRKPDKDDDTVTKSEHDDVRGSNSVMESDPLNEKRNLDRNDEDQNQQPGCIISPKLDKC